MKTMTLCVAAALATALAAPGCGDDDDDMSAPVQPRPGSPADSAPGGAGTSGPAAPAAPDPSAQGVPDDDPRCPARPERAMATRVLIAVRWPASLVLAPGEGEMFLWTKVDLTTTGGAVTGTARPCGSILPELTARPQLGGGKLKLEFPDRVWEAPGMPVFQVTGTSSGFDVGAALSMDPLATLLGHRMSDPLSAAWPEEVPELDTVDHDSDGRPGVLTVPRMDGPYRAPPVELAGVLDPGGPRADEVDLATRTVLALSGTRDSCTSASGTAQVFGIDSHIVGCHVLGGGVCTPDQAALIDAAQPRFTVESASFRMVEVPRAATCADVRAALPAP